MVPKRAYSKKCHDIGTSLWAHSFCQRAQTNDDEDHLRCAVYKLFIAILVMLQEEMTRRSFEPIQKEKKR